MVSNIILNRYLKLMLMLQFHQLLMLMLLSHAPDLLAGASIRDAHPPSDLELHLV